MDPIGLAHAADANFVTHASRAGVRLPGMVARDEPDLVLGDSGLACDTIHFVLRARLDREPAARQASADGAPVCRRLGFGPFGGIVEYERAPGA